MASHVVGRRALPAASIALLLLLVLAPAEPAHASIDERCLPGAVMDSQVRWVGEEPLALSVCSFVAGDQDAPMPGEDAPVVAPPLRFSDGRHVDDDDDAGFAVKAMAAFWEGASPEPSIPPDAIPGWHSRWYAQSDYVTLQPRQVSSFWIRFRNTGTETWTRGTWGRQANLALNGDNKEPFRLGMSHNWLWDDRIATTDATAVAPGEVAQFSFSVRAPALPGSYSLDLRPVIDGTTWMEDEGVFWKIDVPGAATPTPAPGAAPAPGDVQRGGIDFTFIPSTAIDIYVERGSPSAATAQADIDGYVARISASFSRPFARRPTAYVFNSQSSFEEGLHTLFGSDNVAGRNWSGVSAGDMAAGISVRVMMHELTHVMIHQIAGVPGWLNEGLAYSDSWEAWGEVLYEASPYLAAAQAASGRLPPLDDCGSSEAHCSVQAVKFLRDDLGRDGLLRVLDLMGGPQKRFEQAYASVAGKSFDGFRSGFADRVKSVIPSYPSISLFTHQFAGQESRLNFFVAGLAPSTMSTVTITGPLTMTTTGTTTGHGAIWHMPRWAAGGTYVVTVTGPAGSVAATFTVGPPDSSFTAPPQAAPSAPGSVSVSAHDLILQASDLPTGVRKVSQDSFAGRVADGWRRAFGPDTDSYRPEPISVDYAYLTAEIYVLPTAQAARAAAATILCTYFDDGSHSVTAVPTVGDSTQACTYQRTGRPAHDLEYVATYKNVLMILVAEPKSGSIDADSRILLQLADLARRQIALVDAPAVQRPVSTPSPAPRR